MNFIHKGVRRTFKVVVPGDYANTNTAMVVSLHGAAQSANFQEAQTGFTLYGGYHGFIAVYPQAAPNAAGLWWHAQHNSDDVDFVASLTRWLHSQGCSQPQSTSVNGFSMGAMMTSLLMCDRGSLYHGAAMVGGLLEPRCTVDRRKPIVAVHGLRDQVVPYDGSIPDRLNAVGPIESFNHNRGVALYEWAQAKNCAQQTLSRAYPRLFFTQYGCPGGAITEMMLMTQDMHSWDPNPELTRFSTTAYILGAMGITSDRPPQPPRAVRAGPLMGRGQITVTWAAPANAATAGLRGYRIRLINPDRPTSPGAWHATTASQHTLTSLIPKRRYIAQIQAVGDHGGSPLAGATVQAS